MGRDSSPFQPAKDLDGTILGRAFCTWLLLQSLNSKPSYCTVTDTILSQQTILWNLGKVDETNDTTPEVSSRSPLKKKSKREPSILIKLAAKEKPAKFHFEWCSVRSSKCKVFSHRHSPPTTKICLSFSCPACPPCRATSILRQSPFCKYLVAFRY